MGHAWTIGPNRTIPLDRPRIMAILNITPDSFYDRSRLDTIDAARDAAMQAVRDGADILDIGGESTRPGSSRVEPDEQIRRVCPVIQAIRDAPDPLGSIPISVDTTLADVAEAALDAGADAINDVSGGTEDPSLFDLAASRGCGLILMHRLKPPELDSYSDRYQTPPQYDDVVAEVCEFLARQAQLAESRGVDRRQLVLDPGLGFGKTVEQNLELIRRTDEFVGLGYPVLSAASRKSFIGPITGLGSDSGPGDRLFGSLAASVAHLAAGASIFRVHDVLAQVQTLSAAWMILASEGG
jgi:dihydropteroate synthase